MYLILKRKIVYDIINLPKKLEVNLNKKTILLFILIIAIFSMPSCKKKQSLAHVTIVNIGDIAITASVDNNSITINSQDSNTWDIIWEDDSAIEVQLYSEPVGYNDYDETSVVLFDGDVYTWLTGWGLVGGSGSTKLTKKNKF